MQACCLLVAGWAVALGTLVDAVFAQAVLETENLRLEIAADGALRSLSSRPDGAEYAWAKPALPVAAVYRGGDMTIGLPEEYPENESPVYRGGECFAATGASLVDDKLIVQFAKAGVTATYRVTKRPQYLAFTLEALTGEPIDRIDLLQLRIRRLPYLGPWIDVAYDDHFGVCLCGGNLETNAGMSQHADYVEMRAVATREVALQGATAVLFGCPKPRERFLDAMEIVERDFQMPAGARHRRSPLQKHSYLWCSPTPENVDQYIALARRAGLRTILFSYKEMTRGAGHFEFNETYPRGMADLKDVASRIRAAGLGVGFHIHYSKAAKTDSYITPVPDDRLHKRQTFTLAAPLDEKATTIPVRELPGGRTLKAGRRILKIGKELIAFQDTTESPPYQFTGCERGHLKTTASRHAAGEQVALLNVDDWDVFIRFDQGTDIEDEAARRIAEIWRETGPYEVLYFDGAEDVHDPFWYHVAGAQYRVYRLLDPPPPVCEGAMSSHFSWHMLSRGNAYDLRPLGQVKAFCHEISCRTAPIRAQEFTRINFGWVFSFPPEQGPDELEYVLSRGAAWDCPFSIRVSLKEVAAHPRADDCLAAIKLWEDVRINGKLTDAERAALKTLDPKQHEFIRTWPALFAPRWVEAWSQKPFHDQEHHLLVNERGEHELATIEAVADVAGGGIKAYTFQRAAKPGDTYVLLWDTVGQSNLLLPAASDRLTLMRPFGQPAPLAGTGDRTAVRVSSRQYLVFRGMEPAAVAAILRRGEILRQP